MWRIEDVVLWIRSKKFVMLILMRCTAFHTLFRNMLCMCSLEQQIFNIYLMFIDQIIYSLYCMCFVCWNLILISTLRVSHIELGASCERELMGQKLAKVHSSTMSNQFSKMAGSIRNEQFFMYTSLQFNSKFWIFFAKCLLAQRWFRRKCFPCANKLYVPQFSTHWKRRFWLSRNAQ